jgi:hypothetical protein
MLCQNEFSQRNGVFVPNRITRKLIDITIFRVKNFLFLAKSYRFNATRGISIIKSAIRPTRSASKNRGTRPIPAVASTNDAKNINLLWINGRVRLSIPKMAREIEEAISTRSLPTAM